VVELLLLGEELLKDVAQVVDLAVLAFVLAQLAAVDDLQALVLGHSPLAHVTAPVLVLHWVALDVQILEPRELGELCQHSELGDLIALQADARELGEADDLAEARECIVV